MNAERRRGSQCHPDVLSPTSRNWALTLNSGAALPWLCAARLRSSMPLKRWLMARGMMPCSSSEMFTSKPVPMVYVFPAPVCKKAMREELAGFSQAQLAQCTPHLPSTTPAPQTPLLSSSDPHCHASSHAPTPGPQPCLIGEKG